MITRSMAESGSSVFWLVTEKKKQLIRNWIERGSEWDERTLDLFDRTTETRAGRDWWALQPLTQPTVPPRSHLVVLLLTARALRREKPSLKERTTRSDRQQQHSQMLKPTSILLSEISLLDLKWPTPIESEHGSCFCLRARKPRTKSTCQLG